MDRIQLRKMDEVDKLDPEEKLEGYRDALAGEPEPGNNRSYAYWHGWMKGALDKGFRAKTEADAELARDFLKRFGLL